MSGRGVCQNSVDELMSVSADVFNAALGETGSDAVSEAPEEQEISGNASEADVDAIMAGGDAPMDASAIDDMFASAPAEVAEEDAAPEAEDEVAEIDPDATLDEAAIEMLFDSEVSAEGDEVEDEFEAETGVEADAGAEIGLEADADMEAAADVSFDSELEAEADVAWELEDETAADEDAPDDPLQQLSEAERQALFN